MVKNIQNQTIKKQFHRFWLWKSRVVTVGIRAPSLILGIDENNVVVIYFRMVRDTTKELMSSSKCRSVEVINNLARPGSNRREVNCINYK
jgi:hypothetical protein